MSDGKVIIETELDTKDAEKQIKALGKTVSKNMKGVEKEVDNASKSTEKYTKSQKENTKSQKENTEETKKYTKHNKEKVKTQEDSNRRTKESNEQQEKNKKIVIGATESLSKQKSELQKLKQAYNDSYVASGKHSRQTKELGQEIKKTSSSINRQQEKLSKAEKESDKLDKTTKSLSNSINRAGDAAKAAGAKFANFGSKLAGVTKQAAGLAIKGTVAGITATTAAVGTLATASVKAYASYEQLVGGVDTLFKESSKKVQDYADKAYKTAGLSANDYMETVTSFSASLLQSLGGDTDKAAEVANRAIIDMSDNANKMGTAMESIQYAYSGFAKQNYTMLDNLKLGYGGTKSEMERLITDASKMTDIQKDLNVTVEDGSLEFGNIINAISVMQKSLDIAGTTAKEAATTIEGSINSMKSAWKNLLTGISREDADLDSLTDQFVDSVDTVAKNIGPRIKVATQNVWRVLTELIPKLFSKLPSLLNDLLPKMSGKGSEIVMSLIQGISNSIPQILSTVRYILPQILQSLTDKIPMLLEIGMSIISTLVQGISDNLDVILDGVIQIIMTIAQGLVDNLPKLVDSAIQLLQSLGDYLEENSDELIPKIIALVMDIVTMLIDRAPDLLLAAIQIVTALADGIINSIPTLLDKLPQLIESLVKGIIKLAPELIYAALNLIIQLGAGLIAAIPELVKKIPDILKAIKDGLVGGVKDMLDIGGQLMEGMLDGITSKFSKINKKVSDFGSGLIKKVKGVFDIHSPSKKFAEIGEYLALGLHKGFEDEDPLTQMTNDIRGSFGTMQTQLDLEAQGKLDSKLTGIMDKQDNVQVNIALEGDMEGLFNAVKKENDIRKRATGYGVL